jgi:phospho-N-acetylmuramoyl-pentapeptide-transferase
MSLLSTALAGDACFLVWDLNPAKVLMGDTGSMFLGAWWCRAFGCGSPLLLLLVGIVYLCRAGSVILQVLSFKTTGKRIFKMSPIHHHFEMSGWSETKIVAVFSAVTLVGCGVALPAVWLL